ncbi:MAG: DUF3078 domain-containing protein [Saprospiraceae bacterium]
MKKSLLPLLLLVTISFNTLLAQTAEELAQQREAKAAELAKLESELKDLTGKVDGLKGEVAAITEILTPYPRVKKGLSGTVGLNFANFNNWFPKDQPNTSAINLGTSMGGFVNADWKKSFWRNNINLTLGWQKFDDKDNPNDNDSLQVTADAFNIVSLFGWKMTEKWAISTLGEYRTSVLDGRFNDPGYLDIGVGATWTPMSNLVVVIHPLNYNFVFAESGSTYESSLGAKIVADYNTKLGKSITWKSNLSAFISYKGSDFNNYTWLNGLSTAIKGVGIGFDLGLRGNKKEAENAFAEGRGDLKAGDNPLQVFWLIGFSYAIATK